MIGTSTVYRSTFRSGGPAVQAILCLLSLVLAAWNPAVIHAAPVTANPAAPTGQTLIYNSDTSSKAVISVSPWGGGQASIETSTDTPNGGAVKISSPDLYQGGVLTLKTPVALPVSDSQHNWYLFFNIKVIQTAPDGSDASSLQPVQSVIHLADYPESAPTITLAQYPVPGQRRRRGPGTQPGAGGQYQPGGPYQPGARPGYGQQPTPYHSVSPDVPIVIPTVRVQLTLADGTTTAIERDMPAHYAQAPDEWMRIGVPVSALKFANGVTGPLQKITIGATPGGSVWISQIGFAQDNTAITASAGPTQDVSKGDSVNLSAVANGGLADLHYAWTFKDSDGVLEEASGPTASTSYNAGGTSYKVTLVVSDVDGIKKPVTSTTTVKVEE